MSPTANYITQSSVYTRFFTGKLTDRSIAAYQKAGYYGPVSAVIFRDEKRKKIKRARRPDPFELF